MRITVRGRSAHGAMPELGVNAITYMVELIRRLGEVDLTYVPHPYLAAPSMSVNTISGGVQSNVVADRCAADLDIRTVPGQHHGRIVASLRALAGHIESAVPDLAVDVEILQDVPPMETPEDHEIISSARRAAALVLKREPEVRGVDYFSDASVLQPATGVPTVLFGPGDERIAHQVDEYIETAAIVAAARVFSVLPFAGSTDAFQSGLLSSDVGAR
jgi:succinyl-diaminopimelate desuccinylase